MKEQWKNNGRTMVEMIENERITIPPAKTLAGGRYCQIISWLFADAVEDEGLRKRSLFGIVTGVGDRDSVVGYYYFFHHRGLLQIPDYPPGQFGHYLAWRDDGERPGPARENLLKYSGRHRHSCLYNTSEGSSLPASIYRVNPILKQIKKFAMSP